MTQRRGARSCGRLRHWAAAWAVALVLVQTLGLLHRVVHVDARGGDVASSARADAVRPSVVAPGFVASLFADHRSWLDCDLFDQMSHADLSIGGAHDIDASVRPDLPARTHAGWHLAAQAHGFLARGPPLHG